VGLGQGRQLRAKWCAGARRQPPGQRVAAGPEAEGGEDVQVQERWRLHGQLSLGQL